MVARSGHEVLSVVVGTTFAVRTARSFLGPSPSPMHSAPPSAAAGTVAKAVGGHGAGAVAAVPAQGSGRLARAFGAMTASPATVALLCAAFVIREHVLRVWWLRRQRQALEEVVRLLGIAGDDDALLVGSPPPGSPVAPSEPSSALVPARGRPPAAAYVARHGYTATAENQLSLEAGDQVSIEEYDEAGWCWAVATTVRRGGGPAAGFVPGNYLEKIVAGHRRL